MKLFFIYYIYASKDSTQFKAKLGSGEAFKVKRCKLAVKCLKKTKNHLKLKSMKFYLRIKKNIGGPRYSSKYTYGLEPSLIETFGPALVRLHKQSSHSSF